MTKVDIITKIMDGFSKFVGAIKRNGAMYSLWSVILFILLYTFIINPLNVNDIISQVASKQNKEHTESVDKRLLADELIPEMLDKLRLKYGVDRVSLLEMHNSTTNINDVSFLYMSMVYESIDAFNDSINYVSDQYQQQRTSEYSTIIKELARRGHLYLNNIDECKDARFVRLARKMYSNGTHSILFYPLYNGRRLDAMLLFSSSKDDFDYKDVLMNINKPVSKIKSLIIKENIL